MTVAFIHGGNDNMASYRYRCRIPAEELGAKINDVADIMVFCKPQNIEAKALAGIHEDGKIIVADFCDDHFDQLHYQQFAMLADAITCPTAEMQKIIVQKCERVSRVIPDPYELPEVAPHCNGDRLLWFGHAVNAHTLKPYAFLPNLHVVSNFNGALSWSPAMMLREFARADIVIMPATAAYKSPNRTVEAIRQGCFVVAEPHPSLTDIPGIWIGDIKEGIAWATQNPQEANHRTTLAQTYVRTAFSPERTGNAWRTLLTELISTSDAEESVGTALSTSIWLPAQMSSLT